MIPAPPVASGAKGEGEREGEREGGREGEREGVPDV